MTDRKAGVKAVERKKEAQRAETLRETVLSRE